MIKYARFKSLFLTCLLLLKQERIHGLLLKRKLQGGERFRCAMLKSAKRACKIHQSTKLSPFVVLKNIFKERLKTNLVIGTYYNPLTPKSDQYPISPDNFTPESDIKVMRIKEMITNERNPGLYNKFSLSAPQETYREEYREIAH